MSGKNRLTVKICGITRAQDAALAVEAGADWLGFNFWPKSPRHVDLKGAVEIGRALKGAKISKVGVFVDASAEEIRRAVEEGSLDLIQLHGREKPDLIPSLPRPVIKALRVEPGGILDLDTLEKYDMASYIMLDSRDTAGPPSPSNRTGGFGGQTPPEASGSGGVWDWRQAAFAARRYRVILAGGLNPANVADAVRAVSPEGVDVASGVESSPGIKSSEKVRKFIKAAREALP